MKIVFLDIDGVLVTMQTLAQRRERGHRGVIVADRWCLDQLNRVCRATGAQIVISSAWRFSGLLEMRAIGSLWGIEAPIIDLIPDMTTKRPGGLWGGSERWKEIEHWLSQRKDVTSFVIIDDIKDFGPLADMHVCTDDSIGLTPCGGDKAIGILD